MRATLIREQRESMTTKPVALETRWRAASPHFKSYVKRLTASLLVDEDGKGLRKRKRKAADQQKLERTIETICCNLAAVALAFGRDKAPALAVQLGSYASSNSVVYGAHFKRAVALMEERGLLILKRGYSHSKRHRAPSTIRAAPAYWEQANRMAAPERWDALELEDHRDLIVMNGDAKGQRVLPPPDDPWLQRAEAEIRTINEYLKSIPLTVAGLEVLPLRDMPNKLANSLTTPHHRTVRRVLKGTINEGGRLYQAYWLTMRREDRHLLAIAGEPVVTVDYSAAFIRLAYSTEGKVLPPGDDPYDLTGEDHKRTDWTALRTGRKKMLAAMMLMDRPLTRWPGDTVEEQAALRLCFPPGTKPREIVAEIKARHHAIAAEWFERGRGIELHRTESDILIAVLLRLIDLGIRGACPLHDCIICAKSDAHVVRSVMLDEARRITGVDMPVEIGGGGGDGGGIEMEDE
jgi:hypothetical protein